jgi:hypothetical protein
MTPAPKTETEVRVVPKNAALRALTLHPKVASSGLGGSVAVVVLYCLATYAHQDFPSYVAAAITTIVAALCGWAAPADESAA